MEGQKLKSSHFKVSGNQVYVDPKIHGGNPGLLLIYANWCGHCQRFKPTFNDLCRQLGKDFPCTSIEDSDMDDDNLKSALNFRGYPTIKFFDQSGKIIGDYNSGDRSKEALLNHICDLYHHCIKYH
jgi:thiol-disulfide isomerase/thioredoxin